MGIRIKQEESTDFVIFYDKENIETIADVVAELSPKYILISQGKTVDSCAWYLLEPEEFFDFAQRANRRDVPISSILSHYNIEPIQTIKPGEGVPSDAQFALLLDGEIVSRVIIQRPQLEGPKRGSIGIVETDITSFYVAEAEFPTELARGDTGSLIVTIKNLRGALDDATETADIDSVVVIVRADGFEVVGPLEYELDVPVPNEKSVCRYQLKADRFGPGQIEVRFFRERDWLGELMLRPTVVAHGITKTQPLTSTEQLFSPVRGSHPDLVLRIRDATYDGRGAITFELTTHEDLPFDYYNAQFSKELDSEPRLYHRRLFEVIEDMAVASADDLEAIDLMLRNVYN